MPLADYLPRWMVGEARKQAPLGTPATALPAPNVLPNRTGFVQGVPRGGFGEDDASASTGAAQNTTRAEFLQELWEEYLRCPWAWASVNAIARTVTAGGLVMKWDAGQFGQKQPDKPPAVRAFERLLAFCNPSQDIRQLCRNIVADMQVFGGAMVEVVWFAGVAVALYNQDFPTTRPDADEHGNITGWVQTTEDGREAKFRPEQIIHITLDSARPSIFGISPTHAAEESIVCWMYLHACEKEAARRGLPPNIHADLPAGMPEPEVRKWQDQYTSRNIGPANVGTPVTTKGGGTVKELQTAKLTDILAAKKAARDEVVCSYGVPPAKLGIIESGNLGGGTGGDQNKTFVLDVIKPIANIIAEKFQFHLAVQAFGVKGWHVEFPVADYRDDKVIADIQDQQVRLGAMTLNALRAEIGQPPVDGGDDAVLVARQDIVLWTDMAARSHAAVASLTAVNDVVTPPGKPGPPPAVGTEPSKGPGGAPSESAALIAEIERYLRERAVAEHTAKLTPRQRVWNQLSRNFPATALGWVKDAEVSSWSGPVWLDRDQIDTADMAHWDADHQPEVITRLRRRLRKGRKVTPIVVVRSPGAVHVIIVDGHHRALAAMREGHRVRAWVGHVNSATGPWSTLATRQHKAAGEALAGHNGQVA